MAEQAPVQTDIISQEAHSEETSQKDSKEKGYWNYHFDTQEVLNNVTGWFNIAPKVQELAHEGKHVEMVEPADTGETPDSKDDDENVTLKYYKSKIPPLGSLRKFKLKRRTSYSHYVRNNFDQYRTMISPSNSLREYKVHSLIKKRETGEGTLSQKDIWPMAGKKRLNDLTHLFVPLPKGYTYDQPVKLGKAYQKYLADKAMAAGDLDEILRCNCIKSLFETYEAMTDVVLGSKLDLRKAAIDSEEDYDFDNLSALSNVSCLDDPDYQWDFTVILDPEEEPPDYEHDRTPPASPKTKKHLQMSEIKQSNSGLNEEERQKKMTTKAAAQMEVAEEVKPVEPKELLIGDIMDDVKAVTEPLSEPLDDLLRELSEEVKPAEPEELEEENEPNEPSEPSEPSEPNEPSEPSEPIRATKNNLDGVTIEDNISILSTQETFAALTPRRSSMKSENGLQNEEKLEDAQQLIERLEVVDQALNEFHVISDEMAENIRNYPAKYAKTMWFPEEYSGAIDRLRDVASKQFHGKLKEMKGYPKSDRNHDDEMLAMTMALSSYAYARVTRYHDEPSRWVDSKHKPEKESKQHLAVNFNNIPRVRFIDQSQKPKKVVGFRGKMKRLRRHLHLHKREYPTYPGKNPNHELSCPLETRYRTPKQVDEDLIHDQIHCLHSKDKRRELMQKSIDDYFTRSKGFEAEEKPGEALEPIFHKAHISHLRGWAHKLNQKVKTAMRRH
ncbi:hypothetical protein FOA43_001474 [Brettanomyces nanus]|uniref:Uncharacterized protein n=1 Tax=Eeniella nana TaxID=13502 RepID=A0A875RNT6_EENNA|nr:uncharacterized protein FOA43_001474 [Brettanomyces nanus]QPG74150.1 hypothetical protein FOA43_001474 [Brettanomyces nanus]